MSAKIGDVSRTGRCQIIDTYWDHNGTLRVQVRLVGRILHTESDIRAMRRFARRALMYPEKTRSSRVLTKYRVDDSLHVTFAVSRLS